MCQKEKIKWQCYPRASERACVMFSPLFGQGKIIFFVLMVICNSLLLLKSLPINVINCIKFYVNCSALTVVRDSSVVRRHYILLLEPSNVRAQYIRNTADLPHQLWVGTFPRFVAIRFLLTIRNPYINRFTNHFSIHS